MKKIVSQPSNTMVLGEDSVQPPTPVVSPSSSPQVPPKTLLGNSLSKLHGFDELRKSIKIQNSISQFCTETQKILSMFDLNEKKYDHKIVLFVVELAEHFFVSEPKMGKVKSEAVVQCVAPFYNNDERLIKSIIDLVLPQVPKTNAYRRIKGKVKKFFLITAQICLGISLI